MGRIIPYTMENKSHVPNHHTKRADDAKVPPPLNVTTQKKPPFSGSSTETCGGCA